MEKIKDIFHDFSDVFFAIIIASVIFAVLSLNLGSWFNNSSNTVLADKQVNITDDNNSLSQSNNTEGTSKSDVLIEVENNSNNRAEDVNEEQKHNDTKDNDIKEDTQTEHNQPENAVLAEIKTIVIPSGTAGIGIAKILKENQLIEDTNDFIQIAENLKLSSKLKSGTFEISTDTTVEDMVRIIAGQKK